MQSGHKRIENIHGIEVTITEDGDSISAYFNTPQEGKWIKTVSPKREDSLDRLMQRTRHHILRLLVEQLKSEEDENGRFVLSSPVRFKECKEKYPGKTVIPCAYLSHAYQKQGDLVIVTNDERAWEFQRDIDLFRA